MSVLPIVKYPDTRLAEVCESVTAFDASLKKWIQDITDTLYGTTGIGLSGPQVGYLKRVFVMDLSESKRSPEVFINPEILKKSGLGIADEACLSLPGINAKVIRSGSILVRAQDQHGETFEKELDAMSAICVQHEIDHLNGILFIDRISAIRRLPMRRKLARLCEEKHSSANQTTHAKKTKEEALA